MAFDGTNFNTEILKAHNNKRKQHHSQPLKWSNKLAAEAAQWAKHCAGQNYWTHSGTGDGENIAKSGGKTPSF